MKLHRSRGVSVLFVLWLAASLIAACSSGNTRARPERSVVATSAPSPPSTTPLPPAPPRDSAFLHINGPIELPKGNPSTVAVIAVGPLESDAASSSTVVPVIVRNNTSHALFDIRAKAVATVRNATVNTGDSNGFAPFAVRRGEWAFGWVTFTPPLPAAAHLEISATGSIKPPRAGRHVDLAITALRRKQGLSFEGTIFNPATQTLSEPLRVWLVCFNGATPAHVFVYDDLSLAAQTLAPRQSAPFSADMTEFTDDTCATYALGAQE